MKFNLLDQLRRQIGQGIVGIAAVAVVGGHAHDFVVHFAIVHKFHHADHFGFEKNAGGQRLLGNQQHIQLVAVFIQRLRDKAVVGGLGENGRLHAVELESRQFAVPLDFVAAAGRNFVNHIDDAAVHIAGREDLVKISHDDSLKLEVLNGRKYSRFSDGLTRSYNAVFTATPHRSRPCWPTS